MYMFWNEVSTMEKQKRKKNKSSLDNESLVLLLIDLSA